MKQTSNFQICCFHFEFAYFRFKYINNIFKTFNVIFSTDTVFKFVVLNLSGITVFCHKLWIDLICLLATHVDQSFTLLVGNDDRECTPGAMKDPFILMFYLMFYLQRPFWANKNVWSFIICCTSIVLRVDALHEIIDYQIKNELHRSYISMPSHLAILAKNLSAL